MLVILADACRSPYRKRHLVRFQTASESSSSVERIEMRQPTGNPFQDQEDEEVFLVRPPSRRVRVIEVDDPESTRVRLRDNIPRSFEHETLEVEGRWQPVREYWDNGESRGQD